jgi:hypothetical protein
VNGNKSRKGQKYYKPSRTLSKNPKLSKEFRMLSKKHGLKDWEASY